MEPLPTTESGNPRSRGLDAMSARAIARLMNREDLAVVRAVRRELDPVAAAVEGIVGRLGRGGRLVYLGAGSSGRLGVLDAAECPPTFGTDPARVVGLIAGGPGALEQAQEGAEDRGELAVADLERLAVGAADAVVGISASGSTPYALAGVAHARARGAFTVGLSCNRGSPLARSVDVAITPVVGPEILTGSTRLKAGTATKMVLNMLSTASMVLLGRCAGNRMSELLPRSEKLRERASRIVAELADVPLAQARRALAETGGDVRGALARARPPAWIHHVARGADWERAQRTGIYRPASLEHEGFVHCSTWEQLPDTLERLFAGQHDLVLLWIEVARVGGALRWEPTAQGVFPHLYAALPLEAIGRDAVLERSAAGRFVLPSRS